MFARGIKVAVKQLKPTHTKSLSNLLKSKNNISLTRGFQSNQQRSKQWKSSSFFTRDGTKFTSFEAYASSKKFESNNMFGGLLVLGAASALAAFLSNQEERAIAEEKQDNKEKQTNNTTESGSSSESSQSDADADSAPLKLEYKYVIVGAGTAGYAALQEILKHDKEARVLLIGEESYIPYSRPPLSKELWKSEDPNVAQNLKFKDFMGKESEIWFDALPEGKERVDFIMGKSAMDLDPESKVVYLSDRTSIKFDKVLLATGGIPRELPNIPSDLKNSVTTYRTLDDFKHLDKVANGSKHIVVIGGGFLGSEIACGLRTRGQKTGLQVTQVFPESGLMGLVFPKFLSDYATEKVRKELGVDIVPGKVVSKYEKSADGKLDLTLSTGEVIKGVDHVVVSVGIKPDVLLARAADLEIDPQNGGIVVNAELSARSDIFVAGDVASYYDQVLGRRRVEHHDHAVVSGQVAGRNMVGKREPYKYLPFFWSDLGPMGYEAVGIIDGKLKTVSFFEKSADGSIPNPPEYKKGVIYYLNKDNQVVGAILWNNFGKVDEARYAILSRKSFTDDSELKNLVSLEDEHH